MGISFENKTRDEIKGILKSNYDANNLAVTQIWMFIHLPVGSFVISPSYKTRDIHIFQTTSEYEYIEEWDNGDIGNPHTIKAQHLKTVPRSVFSDQVQRALLASKKAVTNFTKYVEEVIMAINDQEVPDMPEKQEGSQSQAELEARETLRELLKSDDEEVRLKAALGLLGKEGI